MLPSVKSGKSWILRTGRTCQMISSITFVCVFVDEDTAVARGWVARLGYGAGERQAKHQDQVSGFPLRFTFSSTLLDWRKKRF